ncbi:MAG: AAA-like domain-containing protein, partial [Candidatus Delongbacteria bacterium]|nr:AAA-like domain-containing protein [Candidatus Delongbacteria bacterium]
MKKEFNDTGLCLQNRHYMVDLTRKLDTAFEMIEKGKYFVINRPRQYGKTTILEMIYNTLDRNSYLPIFLSFETGGDECYINLERFSKFFLEQIYKSLKIKEQIPVIDNFKDFSDEITRINEMYEKKIVLLIDEIDKSSNNDLFINFLAMLRNKYLVRHREKTFHSIILAGLHDIKTLKLKLRPDDKAQYNSPWNIAAEFK